MLLHEVQTQAANSPDKDRVAQGSGWFLHTMPITPWVCPSLVQVACRACRARKDKKLALPEVVVTLTGLGRPVPVYMDTSLIDFKASSFCA